MQFLKRWLSNQDVIDKLSAENVRLKEEIDFLRSLLRESINVPQPTTVVENKPQSEQQPKPKEEEQKPRLSNWNEIRLELERKARKRSIANG